MYRLQQFEALIKGRRILIAGYGREGKSTHALLQKIAPDTHCHIASNDDEIFGHLTHAAESHQPYDLIIKSPGISTMKFEGRCDLNTITSQTDLFLQIYGDLTIGITGTKGKSTTTTLIWHVLSNTLGSQRRIILAGNMGIPLFDIVDQIDATTLVVAELSCHQLENIHRAPHIGVILNLYQEHLDHYHNYQGYQMAKMQMMLRQQGDDHSFYCTNSADLLHIVTKNKSSIHSHLHPYGLTDAKASHLDTLPTVLKGDHNLSNIFVARQVASLCHIDDTQFAAALSSFHGLPHRLELVGEYNGITFYNDSISTIPEATIAAVEALQDVDTLILGGFDRGIDYAPLAAFLVDTTRAGSHIRNLVFVGQAGRRMKDEWQKANISPFAISRNILVEDNYDIIVSWCFTHTHTGSICLLSPAAASYDAFKNFEERGSKYKEYIINRVRNIQ